MGTPRMTVQTQAVLAALLEQDGESWGFELSRLSGLPAGTIYPILQRLAAAGWVVSRWEDPEVAEPEGRPPRRYHRLTVEGRSRAVHALEAHPARRAGLSRLLSDRPVGEAAAE